MLAEVLPTHKPTSLYFYCSSLEPTMFGNKLRSWMEAVRPKRKQQRKEKQSKTTPTNDTIKNPSGKDRDVMALTTCERYHYNSIFVRFRETLIDGPWRLWRIRASKIHVIPVPICHHLSQPIPRGIPPTEHPQGHHLNIT